MCEGREGGDGEGACGVVGRSGGGGEVLGGGVEGEEIREGGFGFRGGMGLNG